MIDCVSFIKDTDAQPSQPLLQAELAVARHKSLRNPIVETAHRLGL